MTSERYNEETYNMRGGRGIPSDRVESHERVINDKHYRFSRVRWSDGTVTVRVWQGDTSNVLHRFDS